MNSNNFDKIALITGISGFVGSHLAQQLVAQGWQVRGLIRASSNLRWIQDLPITLYQCGLTNIESLEGPLQGVTHVFHIAGVVKANSLQQFEAGNVATTATLLQAISKYNKNIQHIVVTSSLAAAGPTVPNLPLIEAMAAKPVNWYGKSKWAQEQVCLNYTQQQQQQPPLPITIIRPPVVYGPRETDVLLFFKLIKRGILLQPTGNKQVLSLIYIDDLVNGLIAAAQSKNTINQTYFLAHNQIYIWHDLAKTTAQILQKKIITISLPRSFIKTMAIIAQGWAKLRGRTATTLNTQKIIEMEQAAWICSPAKAYNDFNFEATTSLASGLKTTLNWYQQHGWL